MKFAQVGYGSQGQGAGEDGEGYTYIVSDNVRTGDTLTPVVKHHKNGKVFITTGQILAKSSTFEGAENKNGDEISEDGLTRAYTGKELGVKRIRGIGGKFKSDRSGRDIITGDYNTSAYENRARGQSLLKYQQEQAIKGQDVSFSQGKATQKALLSADLQEQEKGGSYEDYESMMKRIGAE